MRIRMLLAFALLPLLAACAPSQHWELTSIKGHMPDLKFQLTGDQGKTLTAADFRGKIVLLYFGYTHCPDVCPLAMTHMHMVMQKLGPVADGVRILFVSVDPARDTPQVLHDYVNAFDPRAVGLTGDDDAIRALARRYRVAFTRGKPDAQGNYDVTHSSGIYIFDKQGHARLIATSSGDIDAMVHDIRQLAGASQ
ncbi:MAG TPA: SCO family protein [Rhodanobacteraceae bacterium]|nr:SCO family protein [Rhodanobacteraceae bacterium]